jgi:hypothetical protein
MPSNCLPKHRRARHGDPRLALLPTLDEQARMIELYRRGMSQVAIGRELAWSASTVSRVLIMAGESRPSRIGHPPKLSADTVLETCQLYGLGYSTRASPTCSGSRWLKCVCVSRAAAQSCARPDPRARRARRARARAPDAARGVPREAHEREVAASSSS